MVRKCWSFWPVAEFLFVGVTGVLLHFLYEWTGESTAAALVSEVNESTWEHMKLLFVPLMLFTGIQRLWRKDHTETLWCRTFCSTLAGLAVIPLLYYTYTGALGVSADWFNILIFFVAATVAALVACRLTDRCSLPQGVAVTGLLLLGGLFVLFTFAPPTIPLFRDPITGTYGI